MTHYTRNPYHMPGNGDSEPDGICYVKDSITPNPPGPEMFGARPWDSVDGYVFMGDQETFDSLFTAIEGEEEHEDPRVLALTQLGIDKDIAKGIIGLPLE